MGSTEERPEHIFSKEHGHVTEGQDGEDGCGKQQHVAGGDRDVLHVLASPSRINIDALKSVEDGKIDGGQNNRRVHVTKSIVAIGGAGNAGTNSLSRLESTLPNACGRP